MKTCYRHLDGNEVVPRGRNAYKVLSRTESSAQETVCEFSDSLKVDVGLHLFPSEYVLVEVKLDLLIGDVDAKLLEGVLLEVLEAEDVQDADVQALVFLSGGETKEEVS